MRRGKGVPQGTASLIDVLQRCATPRWTAQVAEAVNRLYRDLIKLLCLSEAL